MQMLQKNVKSLLEQLKVCIFAEIAFGVRCTLNNRVFVSKSCWLIVTLQKFDAFKTNVCLRSEASSSAMLVLTPSKFYTLYLFLLFTSKFLWEANSFLWATLSAKCELRGTDYVHGEISEDIFAPNGDHCVYYPSNLLRNARSFGIYSRIFHRYNFGRVT